MVESSNNFESQVQDESSTQPSPKDWFNSVPSPQISSPLEPEPNKSKRFIVLAVVLASFVIVGVLAYLFVSLMMPKAKACLNNADFATLSGSSTTDKVDAKSGLYTFVSEFSDKNTVDGNTTDYISTLADFYTKRSRDASIIITLSSDYTAASGDSKALADERAKFLADRLVSAGIPASAIHTVASNNRVEYDGEDAPTIRLASITVSSDAKCH